MFDLLQEDQSQASSYLQVVSQDQAAPLYLQSQISKIFLESETHSLCVLKDVTDSIMAERAKSEKYYTDLLIMTVSHEMRNPLNSKPLYLKPNYSHNPSK